MPRRVEPVVPPNAAPPRPGSQKKQPLPWDGWVSRLKADTSLSPEDRDKRIAMCPLLRMNEYMPLWPSEYQAAFMLRPEREMLFGGQARAGKTVGLLLAALQYVDIPGYAALIIRRTEGELRGATGIIPLLLEWIRGKGVEWNEQRFEATFPSGATITFSFINLPGHEKAFRGKAYQFIGYEELTLWEETREWHPYTFTFRSLVPHPTVKIPLRMRSTTNPDGPGRDWVKARFLGPQAQRFKVGTSYMMITPNPKRPDLRKMDRVYIHGVKETNPSLDVEEYELSISLMDPVEAEQQGSGDWEVTVAGGVFNTAALRIVGYVPQDVIARGRGYDPAATEGGKGPRSAGVRMSKIDPRVARHLWGVEVQYVIEHCIAGRWNPNTREDNIDVIACGSAYEGKRRGKPELGLLQLDNGKKVPWNGDPPGTKVLIEQEGAGAGKQVADTTVARLISKPDQHISAEAIKVTDSKDVRAHHLAAAINNGMVAIVRGDWNDDFMAELNAFPNSRIKDIVDATSLVFNWLLGSRPSSGAPMVGDPRKTPEGAPWSEEEARKLADKLLAQMASSSRR